MVGLTVPPGCAFMERMGGRAGSEKGREGAAAALGPSALESAAAGQRRPIKFNFLPQMAAGKQSDD